MNWYLSVKNLSSSSANITNTGQGAFLDPVIYNGEVYGSKENPFYKIEKNQRSGYTPTVWAYINSTTKLRGMHVNAGRQHSSDWQYCRPYLIGDPEGLFTYISGDFIKINNVQISGRYRLKNNISNFTQYGGWTFPINFSVNGVNQKYICVDSATSNQYWFYNCNSTTSMTSSGRPVKYFNEVTSVYTTGADQYSDGFTYNVAYAFNGGDVLDFGDVPQDAPEFFLTWLNNNGSPIYTNSYEVKSSDGVTILASLTEAPAMKQASLTVVNTRKTLILTGVNDVEYFMEWETPLVEGKQFIGLTSTPNSSRVVVPVNPEVAISWVGNLVFYEAYGTYRPPATTFDINLYKNSAEVNRVDKGLFLEGVGTLSGALRDECSLITPSIVYQSSDVPTFNYVYIPIFNRYYFVTSLSSVGKNVWRMELNCDVLMTYKDAIFMLQGVVGRQENEFNPLLVDTEIPAQSNPIVQVIDIPSDAFNTQTSDGGHNFLMTVIGA